MEKAFVAKLVVDKLHATEQAFDNLQICGAELTAALVTARSQLGISATVGSDELAYVAAAAAKVDAARAEIVRAHSGLGAIARRAGITLPRAGFYKEASDVDSDRTAAKVV